MQGCGRKQKKTITLLTSFRDGLRIFELFFLSLRSILFINSIYYEKIYIMDDGCNPYLQSSDVNILLF